MAAPLKFEGPSEPVPRSAWTLRGPNDYIHISGGQELVSHHKSRSLGHD